jgi:hypothetical protein
MTLNWTGRALTGGQAAQLYETFGDKIGSQNRIQPRVDAGVQQPFAPAFWLAVSPSYEEIV